jgi:hypothetical protein
VVEHLSNKFKPQNHQKNPKTKEKHLTRCWWLISIILATLGARDQEDHGSKPAQANSARDPMSKKPSQNRAGRVAQGEGPELKPQYCKINK